MHQRDICLCAECISRLVVTDDDERIAAKIAIACLALKRRRTARIVVAKEVVE